MRNYSEFAEKLHDYRWSTQRIVVGRSGRRLPITMAVLSERGMLVGDRSAT